MQKPKQEQPDNAQPIVEDDYEHLVGADPGVINLLTAQTNRIYFDRRVLPHGSGAETVEVE